MPPCIAWFHYSVLHFLLHVLQSAGRPAVSPALSTGGYDMQSPGAFAREVAYAYLHHKNMSSGSTNSSPFQGGAPTAESPPPQPPPRYNTAVLCVCCSNCTYVCTQKCTHRAPEQHWCGVLVDMTCRCWRCCMFLVVTQYCCRITTVADDRSSLLMLKLCCVAGYHPTQLG